MIQINFKSLLLLMLIGSFFILPTNSFSKPGADYPDPILPSVDLPMSPGIRISARVGTTPGSLSVTPSGAATYSVPIVVPPGRQGIAPSLALVYNSQAGDGLVGIRWSLSGLSSISRCGSNYAMDGQLRRVEYDAQDHFCLDGQRLVEVAPNEFRTDSESFARITAHGSGPDYFIVESKSGNIIRYGCDDLRDDVCMSSVIKARGNIPQEWSISEVRDRQNNYMVYEYAQETNDAFESKTWAEQDKETVSSRPISIKYTGNDSVASGGE
ncbi:MAG: SpvB/TcaC N-terminal domain-containing protein, partial [Patescibacteria group bacterium]